MRQIVGWLLGLSFISIVAFAVLLGSAELLEAAGDPNASQVCRYLGLALAIGWVVIQILLVSVLGLSALGWGEGADYSGSGLGPGGDRAESLPEEDDEESAMPPRG